MIQASTIRPSNKCAALRIRSIVSNIKDCHNRIEGVLVAKTKLNLTAVKPLMGGISTIVPIQPTHALTPLKQVVQ